MKDGARQPGGRGGSEEPGILGADQAVSDRELGDSPSAVLQEAHHAGRAERQQAAQERDEAAKSRAVATEEQAKRAAMRDEMALRRDLMAEARDAAADRRDSDSAKIERKMASRGSSLAAALRHAAEVRALAAEDRARAARDRMQAASDRERAAEERSDTLAELRRAHIDELTGAFRRGAGEEAVMAEIDRARRGGGRMVLAFVDVDALRAINNRDGHAAGDALLREVVAAIRANMRSYEPIVRFGGDEFVCAISDLDLVQAKERFEQIKTALSEDTNGAISVGLAELRPEDNLHDLMERADADLLAARRDRAQADGPAI